MKDAVNRLPDQIRRPKVNSGSLLHLYDRGFREGDKRRRLTQRQRKKCRHHKKLEPAKKGRKRELPYNQIRELHEHGLSGAAIARELRLIPQSVTYALRTLGLGTGRHNHKRKVLSDGKVWCRVCQQAKNANEFGRYGSVCRHCSYRLLVKKCNDDLDRNLRMRYCRLRRTAKRCGVAFTLTEEQFKAKYVEQNGRCFYDEKTVLDLQLGKGLSREQLSADRLQPEGPYSNENVVLTTQYHNLLRKRMDPATFRTKLLAGELPAKKVQQEKAGVAN